MSFPSSTADKSFITIGVVGGGIGGVITAIALGRIGYTVHLFEQASKFSEIGAGVALAPNSLSALEHLSLLSQYEKVADITSQPEGQEAMWFTFVKWNTAELICDVTSKGRQSSVHRARLLESLLPLLPPNVTTHFSSRVTAAENITTSEQHYPFVRIHIAPPHAPHPEYVELHTFDVDVCIGADGVKSAVRGSLGLGAGPELESKLVNEGRERGAGGSVRYTGIYAYRGLLDMKEAIQKIGEDAKTPRMWLGPKKHVLTLPIEGGNIINLVAFVSDRSQPENARTWEGPWVKPVGKEDLLGDFEGWHWHVPALLELIKKPERWALHELVPLEKWTVGRVTLLGDSAHASLPHNGAGAGQATEDAYILASLMAHPSCTQATVAKFLEAYEKVRRPRASKQQIWALKSGEIYDLESPLGDDWEKIGQDLTNRYKWIWEHDLEKDLQEALEWLRLEKVIE